MHAREGTLKRAQRRARDTDRRRAEREFRNECISWSFGLPRFYCWMKFSKDERTRLRAFVKGCRVVAGSRVGQPPGEGNQHTSLKTDSRSPSQSSGWKRSHAGSHFFGRDTSNLQLQSASGLSSLAFKAWYFRRLGQHAGTEYTVGQTCGETRRLSCSVIPNERPSSTSRRILACLRPLPDHATHGETALLVFGATR